MFFRNSSDQAVELEVYDQYSSINNRPRSVSVGLPTRPSNFATKKRLPSTTIAERSQEETKIIEESSRTVSDELSSDEPDSAISKYVVSSRKAQKTLSVKTPDALNGLVNPFAAWQSKKKKRPLIPLSGVVTDNSKTHSMSISNSETDSDEEEEKVENSRYRSSTNSIIRKSKSSIDARSDVSDPDNVHRSSKTQNFRDFQVPSKVFRPNAGSFNTNFQSISELRGPDRDNTLLISERSFLDKIGGHPGEKRDASFNTLLSRNTLFTTPPLYPDARRVKDSHMANSVSPVLTNQSYNNIPKDKDLTKAHGTNNIYGGNFARSSFLLSANEQRSYSHDPDLPIRLGSGLGSAKFAGSMYSQAQSQANSSDKDKKSGLLVPSERSLLFYSEKQSNSNLSFSSGNNTIKLNSMDESLIKKNGGGNSRKGKKVNYVAHLRKSLLNITAVEFKTNSDVQMPSTNQDVGSSIQALAPEHSSGHLDESKALLNVSQNLAFSNLTKSSIYEDNLLIAASSSFNPSSIMPGSAANIRKQSESNKPSNSIDSSGLNFSHNSNPYYTNSGSGNQSVASGDVRSIRKELVSTDKFAGQVVQRSHLPQATFAPETFAREFGSAMSKIEIQEGKEDYPGSAASSARVATLTKGTFGQLPHHIQSNNQSFQSGGGEDPSGAFLKRNEEQDSVKLGNRSKTFDEEEVKRETRSNKQSMTVTFMDYGTQRSNASDRSESKSQSTKQRGEILQQSSNHTNSNTNINTLNVTYIASSLQQQGSFNSQQGSQTPGQHLRQTSGELQMLPSSSILSTSQLVSSQQMSSANPTGQLQPSSSLPPSSQQASSQISSEKYRKTSLELPSHRKVSEKEIPIPLKKKPTPPQGGTGFTLGQLPKSTSQQSNISSREDVGKSYEMIHETVSRENQQTLEDASADNITRGSRSDKSSLSAASSSISVSRTQIVASPKTQEDFKTKDTKKKGQRERRNSTAPIPEKELEYLQANYLTVERRKSKNPTAESLPTIGELQSQSNYASSYNLLDRDVPSITKEPSIVNLYKVDHLRDNERDRDRKESDKLKSSSQSYSNAKSSVSNGTFSDVSQENIPRREQRTRSLKIVTKRIAPYTKDIDSPARSRYSMVTFHTASRDMYSLTSAPSC